MRPEWLKRRQNQEQRFAHLNQKGNETVPNRDRSGITIGWIGNINRRFGFGCGIGIGIGIGI